MVQTANHSYRFFVTHILYVLIVASVAGVLAPFIVDVLNSVFTGHIDPTRALSRAFLVLGYKIFYFSPGLLVYLLVTKKMLTSDETSLRKFVCAAAVIFSLMGAYSLMAYKESMIFMSFLSFGVIMSALHYGLLQIKGIRTALFGEDKNA